MHCWWKARLLPLFYIWHWITESVSYFLRFTVKTCNRAENWTHVYQVQRKCAYHGPAPLAQVVTPLWKWWWHVTEKEYSKFAYFTLVCICLHTTLVHAQSSGVVTSKISSRTQKSRKNEAVAAPSWDKLRSVLWSSAKWKHPKEIHLPAEQGSYLG